MKVINDRCPLAGECERKKCECKNHELDCTYYHANARPGYEIADQEELRNRALEHYWETMDEDDMDEELKDLEENTRGSLISLPIIALHPHPDNPRKDLGDLTELAASIKAKGVLQNLTVVRADEGGYRIITGHRRHAAAKLAGLAELPCVIADMTPQEQFETMMVENVQRSNLTVYEQAEGFQMMLDMGGSVEQVAEKTGFSETTIRRRVKLLDLDKKKFQKAEARGATMADYMKLNEIKDPEVRNKVLDHVGTAEFNVRLKMALEDEAFQERMERVLNYFRNEQDWCKERTDEEVGYGEGQYSYYTAYSKHNTKDPQIPDNVGTVDYIWCITAPNTITIYKKLTKSAEKAPLSPAGQLKQKLKDDLEEIKNELNHISKTHREMREDFIHDFNAVHNYEMDIQAFAAMALIHLTDGYVHRLDTDRLGNLMGVQTDSSGIMDEEGLKKALFHRPQHALLCATYVSLEGVGQKYNDSGNWITDIGFPPAHKKSPTLDLIYKGLESIGYEMSEEELLMQVGTHPLFRKVKELIAEYNKAMEEINNG